jgi:hypothetical protein
MDYVFEIFRPNDTPTPTYVERDVMNNETKLRDALKTPNMVIPISDPSKTGKTALVNRALDSDNIILVSGASIESVEDLWKAVMRWIGGPEAVSETMTKASTLGGEAGVEVGGSFFCKRSRKCKSIG